MKLSERQKVHYAKSELRQYKTLVKTESELVLKIDTVVAEIASVKSSPVSFNGGTGVSSEGWKNDKREELVKLQESHRIYVNRIRLIHNFLNSLNCNDRELIENVYIRNKTIRSQSIQYNISERQLKYEIDKAMTRFKMT